MTDATGLLYTLAIIVWLAIYGITYYKGMTQVYAEGKCDTPTLVTFLVAAGILVALFYSYLQAGGTI